MELNPQVMSESRSEFEAAALTRFNATGVPRIISEGAPRAGEYEGATWQLCWEFWQASRRAALESAAKACEAVADGHHGVASVSDPQAGAFYGSLVSPGHDPYNFKPYDQAGLPDGAIPFCAPYNGRKEG